MFYALFPPEFDSTSAMVRTNRNTGDILTDRVTVEHRRLFIIDTETGAVWGYEPGHEVISKESMTVVLENFVPVSKGERPEINTLSVTNNAARPSPNLKP